MSRLDKGEKGTNLAQEYSISKQQISDIRKDKDKNLKSTIMVIKFWITFVQILYSRCYERQFPMCEQCKKPIFPGQEMFGDCHKNP